MIRWVRGSRLRAALVLLLLLALVWTVGDFAYVSIGGETDYAAHADVIIVLGCRAYQNGGPSSCMRARAGHAADLYRQGFATEIIATGGMTDQGPIEAAVLSRVLQENGVPESAITEETQATDTIQNILNSRAIMWARGWHTAVLVTEPFHINRASLIARDAGLIVFPSPALNSPNWTQPFPRVYNLGRDTLSLMLYQLKGLIGIKS